uniref:Regulator of chromosome condensation n=2 Tax=Guillardia theta TaxID=55529 RepID=A0A7S4U658_GUITH
MLMDSYEHVFTAVACGDRFTIAVTARGRMFTWGLNTCGQLGHGPSSDGKILRPQQIRVVRERGKGNELETRNQESIFVLDVAAGPEHAMMLADNGFVYTWGSGDSGRLGHGNEAMVSRPTQVWRTMNSTRSEELGLSCEATHVACGEAHSMAMTVEGFLYVWGCMEGGRLGLISAKVDGDFIADVDWKSYNLQEPKGEFLHVPFRLEISPSERVVDAAAGVRHNTIITKDRDDENEGAGTDNDVDLEQGDGNKQAGCTSFLYWWGENVGNEDNLVVVDDKDKDVRNRDERFYDDDDDDEFYRHVSERTGELLEQQDKLKHLKAPTKVFIDADVATVAAGESFSCAITDDGKLYTWGLATSGQLGYHARAADTDQLLFSSKPRRVSMPMDLSITHVSCGAQICFAVGTPSTDAARAVLERNLSTTLEDNDRSLAMGREFAALAI